MTQNKDSSWLKHNRLFKKNAAIYTEVQKHLKIFFTDTSSMCKQVTIWRQQAHYSFYRYVKFKKVKFKMYRL